MISFLQSQKISKKYFLISSTEKAAFQCRSVKVMNHLFNKNLWWIIKSIYIFYYWPTPTYTVDKSFSYYSFQENLPLATNPQLLVTSHQSRITQPTTKRHSSALFDAYLEKLWNLAPAHFTVHVGCPAKLRATVCRPRESRIARRPLPCLFDCHPPAAALAGKGNILISLSPRRFVSLSSMDFIKKKTESTGNPLRKDHFLSDHSIGRARDFYTVT